MQLTSTDFRGVLSRRFFDNFVPVPARCRFQLGQVVPDMVLSGTDGQPYRLFENRGKPVVLVFARIFTEKQYCPFCYPHILAVRKAYAQFVTLGADLLLISSTPVVKSKLIQQDLSLPMPVLSDASCKSFRQYGTGQALGAPLPAQFVVDAEGKLRFQHLFSFAHTHATPARLLWAIRNL